MGPMQFSFSFFFCFLECRFRDPFLSPLCALTRCSMHSMNSEHMCFGQVKIVQQPKMERKSKPKNQKKKKKYGKAEKIEYNSCMHTVHWIRRCVWCMQFLHQELKAIVRYLGEINVLLLSFQLPAFFNISKQIENTSGEKRARSLQYMYRCAHR